MAIFLEDLLCYYSRDKIIYHYYIAQNIYLSFRLNFFQTGEECLLKLAGRVNLFSLLLNFI